MLRGLILGRCDKYPVISLGEGAFEGSLRCAKTGRKQGMDQGVVVILQGVSNSIRVVLLAGAVGP